MKYNQNDDVTQESLTFEVEDGVGGKMVCTYYFSPAWLAVMKGVSTSRYQHETAEEHALNPEEDAKNPRKFFPRYTMSERAFSLFHIAVGIFINVLLVPKLKIALQVLKWEAAYLALASSRRTEIDLTAALNHMATLQAKAWKQEVKELKIRVNHMLLMDDLGRVASVLQEPVEELTQEKAAELLECSDRALRERIASSGTTWPKARAAVVEHFSKAKQPEEK